MNATAHEHEAERVPATRRAFFLALIGAWIVFGLWLGELNALLTIASGGEAEPWLNLVKSALVFGCFWALLTPVLMWSTRRLHDRIPSAVGRIAAHAVIALGVHLMDVTVWSTMSTILGISTRPYIQLLLSFASFNVLTYAIVAVGTTALDYRDAFRERGMRAAQLEAQLALAQFHALRAQLQPHFLFNSLNSISALMHKDVERADRMLASLGELLRTATHSAGAPEVKLSDEIEFVQRYLDIEQIRFGDRLQVHVDVPAEAREAFVPTMLLQPIVENAVRHGVAPHSGRGRVDVLVEQQGRQLAIVVRDTGKGMDPVALAGGHRDGVGLRATRARLEKLYGAAHELVLVNAPSGGFETRIMLPFRTVLERAQSLPSSRAEPVGLPRQA